MTSTPALEQGDSKLKAVQFLNFETLVLLRLCRVAFSIGTASGIIMAKLMNLFRGNPITPLSRGCLGVGSGLTWR